MPDIFYAARNKDGKCKQHRTQFINNMRFHKLYIPAKRGGTKKLDS